MIVNGYEIKPEANLSWAYLSGAYLSEADLSGANLSKASLIEANLSGAYLSGADLSGADLREAYLSRADLREANLRGADLHGANLSVAYLSGANLRGASLSEAYLSGANLSEANLSGAKNVPSIPWTIVPSEGDIIVYKKLLEGVCTLLIPKEAKRLNATGRKCRAEFAIVLNLPEDVTIGHSIHDDTFVYEVGQRVTPKEPFCEDRWAECSSGIHFFITREEAENY